MTSGRQLGALRLTPLDEAVDALIAIAPPVAPRRVPVARAGGCVVAETVVAPMDVPPGPLALRDGWAVAAADTVGASSYAPGFPAAPPGWCAAGEALPAGADAILPPAAVQMGAGPAQILASAAPGEGARRAGGDFAIGQPLVAAGERLRADHVALLHLAGIEAVQVRQPRVAILSSARGAPVGTWVAAMIEAEGASFTLDIVLPSEIRQPTPGATTADLVLLIGDSGAVEFGGADALAPAAFTRGVAVRPGEALGWGRPPQSEQARAPIVLIPERMEEGFAGWFLLVRPCLHHLSGARPVLRGDRRPLTRKIVSNPGVSDLVVLKGADAHSQWQPLATGDVPWAAMARAEAWLVVPAASEGYAAGEPVFANYL